MRQIAEFVAVLTCSVFAGAALYISFVEHPAKMQRGTTKLPASYRHAGDSSGFGTAIVRGRVARGRDVWWPVGGVLLGAVIPFTLIVILPTNKRLLNKELDRRSAQTERLLARWGRFQAVAHCGLSFKYDFLREERGRIIPAKWRKQSTSGNYTDITDPGLVLGNGTSAGIC
jgi:hypothetical protein